MNIFQIIISKVSATITAIFISFGLASTPVVTPPVVEPVQVVVATTTSTEPEVLSKPIQFLSPDVVETPVATTTTTATTTPVVQATTSPVVVPVEILPTTTYQVAPSVAPQVIIQIQQQAEAPVASAPAYMGTTYTLKNGSINVLENATEQEVRAFAEKLNNQINWKKQVRIVDMEKLTQALESNGYTLIEN